MGLQMPNLNDAIAALSAADTDKFLKELNASLADMDKLNSLAKQMQGLSQQMEKLGKDLAEQLKKGQADLAQPRAETPLWTQHGDPLLAHWQFGLGRAVAFKSDAKPRWAKTWLAWEKYR